MESTNGKDICPDSYRIGSGDMWFEIKLGMRVEIREGYARMKVRMSNPIPRTIYFDV